MAKKVDVKDLLAAGVHFGHLTRKWNPHMAPYIFMEKNGIHIIDLHKTAVKLESAAEALEKIAASGRRILFVATKKQAKEVVSKCAEEVTMPYITERWPGGMLTNFITIRKAVKKMNSIDRMKKDGTFESLSKKERLQIDRQRANLEKNLGSISDMTRLPSALFVVDILKEHIAVTEAKKLGIPVFAIVDTNSDPQLVDFPIPGNDDASKSIELLLGIVCDSIKAGLSVRKAEKSKEGEEEDGVEKPAKEDKVEEKKPAVKKEEEAEEKKPATKKPVAKKEDKVEDEKPAVKKEEETEEKKPAAKKPAAKKSEEDKK